MPTLTWERRDGQRQVFLVHGIETVIGRDLGNPVQIESGYVSKRHAVIRLGAQGYTIADLNSSNGIAINGQRVTTALLKDGDRIELGSEVLRFAGGVEGSQRQAPASSKRKLMLLVAAGGGVILLLLLLVIVGSSPPEQAVAPPSTSGVPPAAPAIPSTPGPQGGAPSPDPARAPAAAPPADPQSPAARVVPAGDGGLPSSDPVALYDMAMAHIKGGRLVEARRLLVATVTIDPRNTSAHQRLREVDATIPVLIDRYLANGQRAFTYLRYQDAINEWEQALSMTEPSDPRYEQAASGIRRARERLGR